MDKLTLEFWNFLKQEKIGWLERVNLLINVYLKRWKRVSKVIRYHLHTNSYWYVHDLEQLQCKQNVLICKSNRKNCISSPIIFEDHRNFTNLEGYSPDLKVSLLTKCFIFSRSTSISDGERLYNTAFLNISPACDIKNDIFLDSYNPTKVTYYSKAFVTLDDKSIYIHLLNEHSKNYYHWLFEVMPKFIKICEVINNTKELSEQSYILLLDYNLPSQFFDILKYYSTINYTIKIVNRFQAFFSPRIIYCTDFWISLDNTKFVSDIQREFFVDREAIMLLKTNNIKYNTLKKFPTRRIYLARRSTQLRALTNVKEVQEVLLNQHFEIVYTDGMSFLDQIQLFNEAKIIIGSSGAAFSNMIFMQPNTRAIIFSPNTRGANYYIFQQMADISNINLTHLLTRAHSKDQNIHSLASLDIIKLKKLLDEMNL